MIPGIHYDENERGMTDEAFRKLFSKSKCECGYEFQDKNMKFCPKCGAERKG